MGDLALRSGFFWTTLIVAQSYGCLRWDEVLAHPRVHVFTLSFRLFHFLLVLRLQAQRQQQRLVLCGHSLGGAVAAISTLLLLRHVHAASFADGALSTLDNNMMPLVPSAYDQLTLCDAHVMDDLAVVWARGGTCGVLREWSLGFGGRSSKSNLPHIFCALRVLPCFLSALGVRRSV